MPPLRTSLLVLAVICAHSPALAYPQVPTQTVSTGRLTYRFDHPKKTALALAKAGLPSFDAELVSIDLERGDSVAQITARVRDDTWARNPEVKGGLPGNDQEVNFGPIQSYLAGDQRLRILVTPARCAGCAGALEVVFLRFLDTGYLVGRPTLRPH